MYVPWIGLFDKLTAKVFTFTIAETWSPLTTLLKLINPGFKLDPYCELEDVIPLTINANGEIVAVLLIGFSNVNV